MVGSTSRIQVGEDGSVSLGDPRLIIRQGKERTANQYYRCQVPMSVMEDMDLGKFWVDESLSPPDATDQKDIQDQVVEYEGYQTALRAAMEQADGYYYWHDGSEYFTRLRRALRRDNRGSPAGAPIFIFDVDDNLEFVNPFNPAFARIGTRTPDGQLMAEGSQIRTIGPGGDPVTLWEDGQMTPYGRFDIARNRQNVRRYHTNAKEADGVCVPVESLAEYYRDELHCENVYVLPNSIIFDDYPKLPVSYDTDEIRILWQGGASHFPDLVSVADALERVAKRYSNVVFYIFGTLFPVVFRNIPEEQIRQVKWVPHEAYHHVLCSIGPHINICPLTGLEFNKYKSSIKYYEASAIPDHPAATVAANYGPYQEIEDGTTGLLYESDNALHFQEQLVRLIEDEKLRRDIGHGAYEWVKEHRDAYKTVPAWVEWIQKTRTEAQ